jgi:protein involved in polysaccharide export with SLBB domain
VVRKAERIVTLTGEVTRPGAYQLLSGEGISELLGYYGDKPLASARTDLAQLTRRATADKPESESLLVDLESESLPELANGDTLRVPAREEYLPIVYLEGAISSEKSAATTNTAAAAAAPAADAKQADAGGDDYGTVRVSYRQGLLLSQAFKAYIENLSPKADLRKAYVVKSQSSAIVPVDLEKLLYAYDVKDDLELKANDRVVIPYASQGAYVTGEVRRSSWVEVTGRTRLSEALKDALTPYSQVRSVVIRSADGTEKSCDLFLADRKGDLSQDPLLRPGDIVNVARADRLVNVLGDVRRPGKYPLRADEGLRDLVNYYADGALESAKTDLVVVTRKATKDRPESESLVVDLSASALPDLYDGDEIMIPSRDEYLPVMYVEGAIRAGAPESPAAANGQSPLPGVPASVQESQSSALRSSISDDQKALLGTAIGNDVVTKNENATSTVQQASALSAAVETYGIKRIPLRKGQRVSFVARQLRESFSENASLKNAYIVRGAERIAVNVEKLLYAYDAKDDLELSPDDRLVIPFGGNEALVRGEVIKAMRVQVTSATRLVEVLKGNLTSMSSIRDVEVVSADGSSRNYDLFLVERKGDRSQNPPLRPGDIVEVKRLNRVVAILGEVNRPGTYQLLPGETLKQLVEEYAGGFTEKANLSRMTIVRYVSETNPMGEKLIVDYGVNQEYALNKYDAINVPPYQDLLPVVWFEGAVGVVGELKTAPQAAQRIPYTYFPGDMVSEAVLANRKLFSEVSDLKNAYVVRSGGPKKAVDLSRFLYDRSFSEDLRLEPNDVIVVPFRQFFVTVSGAVRSPGRYPYVPDRTWGYYVNLAGGFDTDRNVNEKVTVYDMAAKKMATSDRYVQPEDMIVAESNSFVYNMLKVASILSTAISLVALVISLLP